MMRVSGKGVLVTGAGGGLGAAIAKRLAEEGARVLCTDLGDRAEAVAEAIVTAGGVASAMTADVTRPEDCEAQVAETVDRVLELRKLQATNKKALKAARAWLMAKSDLYDGGLCPLEELNDALLSYFDRKIGYEQAVHDHNVATAHLERLVGSLADDAPDQE